MSVRKPKQNADVPWLGLFTFDAHTPNVLFVVYSLRVVVHIYNQPKKNLSSLYPVK
jgi:hypothetical protein